VAAGLPVERREWRAVPPLFMGLWSRRDRSGRGRDRRARAGRLDGERGCRGRSEGVL